MLGVFVTYLPITGVSVSLSTIGRATSASTADLQWVQDAFVIPMAAAVLSAGVFGDRHGRRRVLSLGMVLTVVGSITAGLAATAGSSAMVVLWVGQAISGLGAGLILPTTLALIAVALPDPHARGKYIGLWATGMVGGLAVGPLFSGLILLHLGWGWIFAPVAVLSVVAGVIAHLALPESKSPIARHLDWPGQISASIAIAASIFGVIEGGSRGWTSLPAVLGLGIGVIALIGFIVLERRSSSPLMDLRLFRSPSFVAAGLAALVALFSVVGTMFLLSLFLGTVQRLDPLQIGLRLLFVTGIAAVMNPVTALIMTKARPILVLTFGLLLCILGVALQTGVDGSTGFGQLAWRLAIFGISLSFMLTPVSAVAINSVPWQQAGMAAATNTVLRQFGGALGPAVLGAVFVSNLTAGETSTAALHAALIVTLVLLAVAAAACAVAAISTASPRTAVR